MSGWEIEIRSLDAFQRDAPEALSPNMGQLERLPGSLVCAVLLALGLSACRSEAVFDYRTTLLGRGVRKTAIVLIDSSLFDRPGA